MESFQEKIVFFLEEESEREIFFFSSLTSAAAAAVLLPREGVVVVASDVFTSLQGAGNEIDVQLAQKRHDFVVAK